MIKIEVSDMHVNVSNIVEFAECGCQNCKSQDKF